MEDIGEVVTGGSYGGLTMRQAAARLRSDGVLLEKHEGFTTYGVKLRNAAEHPDTDQELGGDRWVITPKTAQTYLRGVLDFIRSADAKINSHFEI